VKGKKRSELVLPVEMQPLCVHRLIWDQIGLDSLFSCPPSPCTVQEEKGCGAINCTGFLFGGRGLAYQSASTHTHTNSHRQARMHTHSLCLSLKHFECRTHLSLSLCLCLYGNATLTGPLCNESCCWTSLSCLKAFSFNTVPGTHRGPFLPPLSSPGEECIVL
jgi:hypothetical protein